MMRNTLMSVRFLSKSLLGRKSYFAVTVAAVALGISLVAALISISLDVGEKVGGTLRSYGANVVLIPTDKAASSGGETYIHQTNLRSLKSNPPKYLISFSPLLYGVVKVNGEEVVMAGADLKLARKISPWWQLQGRWPQSDAKDEAIVGIDLAKRLNLQVGSQLKVAPASVEAPNPATLTACQTCHRALPARHATRVKHAQNSNCLSCHKPHSGSIQPLQNSSIFTVRGIIKSGLAEDEQILVRIQDAQALLNRPQLLSEIQTSVLANQSSIDQIGKKLEQLVPGTRARVIKQIANAEANLLRKVQLLMALVTALILGASVLAVSSTITVNIMERSREIGLMKALGATGARIAALFLVEVALVGLTGGFIGYLLGIAFAQIIGRSVFDAYIGLRPVVMVITLLVALFTSMVPSILPIRRALRTEPAMTLRGE